jgi:hypothetical protein
MSRAYRILRNTALGMMYTEYMYACSIYTYMRHALAVRVQAVYVGRYINKQ